jgi:hypothetical protein
MNTKRIDRATLARADRFSTDHDASAMHIMAEATGGTFSFIKNAAELGVQELRVDGPYTGVRLRSVSSAATGAASNWTVVPGPSTSASSTRRGAVLLLSATM